MIPHTRFEDDVHRHRGVLHAKQPELAAPVRERGAS